MIIYYAMKPATIQLNHLTIGYRRKQRLYPIASHLHATLYGGELTCLLGANGAGKSTLLRTLSAFLPPLEGSVEIMGKPISAFTDKELARHVSVVLTERIEVQGLRVHEVVALGRTPYTGLLGQLTTADQTQVDEAIRLTGITPLANRPIDTLSDGERQKAMIAKALAQDTPVIYLDEPTAFLDYPSKVEMMQLLHRLSRTTGKTIFLSTHDLDLAFQMADTIWLLHRSGSLTTGLPEDLIQDGTLPKFFESEGISFDSQTGHFRVKQPTNRRIQVVGEGLPLLLLTRALNRNGIATEPIAAENLTSAENTRIQILTSAEGETLYHVAPQQTIYPTLKALLQSF